MILDALQQFDPAGTSVAIAQGTQPSTNELDYGILSGIPSSANGGGARDMGVGDTPALKLVVQVTTSFASAGSTGTISAAVQFAPDDGTGVAGTWVTSVTSALFTIPTAGTRLLDIDMPRPKFGTPARFCRLLYTVATQDMSAGALGAWVVLDRFDQPSTAGGVLGGYPPGLVVAN